MADDIPLAPPETSALFRLSEVVDLATLEKRYLEWVRTNPESDLPTLAGKLGISPRTLYRKLQNGRNT